MKIPFNSENKQKTAYDYPKLHLNQGEQARVVVIDPEPELGFAHRMAATQIVNGQPVMETLKGKNGEYQAPKKDFLANAQCFGAANTLVEKNKDPQNCPICAAANASDWVDQAKRRYALHVFKYKVQPGSFTPALLDGRIQGEVLVWGFTNMVYDTLVNISEEHGDLRQRDLLLGPCTNKGFQKFEIQVGGSAAWLTTEENKQIVASMYQQEKVEDLSVALGMKISREKAEEYIDQIMMKGRQAFGGDDSVGSGVSNAGEAATSLDLDSMLKGTGDSAPAAPDASVSPAPVEDFSLDVTASETVESAAPEPVESPAEEQKGDPLDFSSILKGL